MRIPEPVRCQQHGNGPWCHDMGEHGHIPIRPIITAIREEVERRIPRRERRTPPEPTPDGGEEELEIRRARAAVAHILRDWLPRTLALQASEPHPLLQQAERIREKMDENPEWNEISRTAREMMDETFLDETPPPALDICLKTFGLAVSAKRIREKQHEGWRASQRDFIGREIGEAADAMLEAYQKMQTPLDLARELENLLEMTRP